MAVLYGSPGVACFQAFHQALAAQRVVTYALRPVLRPNCAADDACAAFGAGDFALPLSGAGLWSARVRCPRSFSFSLWLRSQCLDQPSRVRIGPLTAALPVLVPDERSPPCSSANDAPQCPWVWTLCYKPCMLAE